METFGYIASLIIGITLGLVGGGGAILTVPVIVYLFKETPMMATSYSLFIVGISSLVGSFIYLREGHINFKTVFLFSPASILGAYFSRAFLLPAIPENIIHINNFLITKNFIVITTFAILMISSSYSMIRKESTISTAINTKRSQKKLIPFIGLAVGSIAGFVGAGGGFLIIPSLIKILELPVKTAIGSSLTIIALQSLTGFGGDLYRGTTINWSFLFYVTLISTVGILIGSSFSKNINEQKLKASFGWLVLTVGSIILVEQINRILL